MKKQAYMKPAMQVVELRQSLHLLGGSQSPNGYDGKSISIQSKGQISDEEDIW